MTRPGGLTVMWGFRQGPGPQGYLALPAGHVHPDDGMLWMVGLYSEAPGVAGPGHCSLGHRLTPTHRLSCCYLDKENKIFPPGLLLCSDVVRIYPIYKDCLIF